MSTPPQKQTHHRPQAAANFPCTATRLQCTGAQRGCRDKERQKRMIFKSPREAAAKELARHTKKSYFCPDNFNNQNKKH